MPSVDASARPSQVTVAGWSIAIASTVLLVSVFDAASNLHSIDARDQITQMLRSGSAKGLGLSVADALEIKRWGLYVCGAAAAAAAILGVYALQRNKGARIGLSLAAVPIVLTAPFSGSFLGMFIGVATAYLWSGPARDWFAGRPVTVRERRQVEPPPTPQVPPTPTPWIPPTSVGAPPTGPAMPPQAGPPAPLAYGQQPLARAVDNGRPPRQVRVACILTWVLSGITGLGYLVALAAVAVDRDRLLKLVKQSPSWNPSYDDNTIVTAVVVVCILFLVWCLAVSTIAVFTWRGASWAWVLHVVSSGFAALVAVLAFPYSIVHLTAIGMTFAMLLGAPVRAWFRSR